MIDYMIRNMSYITDITLYILFIIVLFFFIILMESFIDRVIELYKRKR